MEGTEDREVERVECRDAMVRVVGEQVLEQLDDSLAGPTLWGLVLERFAVVVYFALDGLDERLLDVVDVEGRGSGWVESRLLRSRCRMTPRLKTSEEGSTLKSGSLESAMTTSGATKPGVPQRL